MKLRIGGPLALVAFVCCCLGSAETGAQNAYITNLGSNTVSVIATATNTVTATIPVGAEPRGAAVSPDGSTVYITNTVDGTVSVVNTATNTVIATISVGSLPLGVAVTPDGSTVYIANFGGDNVSVIAAATNTVTATIPVGGEPNGVVLSPDGSTVYVANLRSGTVSVIDTASNTVVDTITDASFNNLSALGHFIGPAPKFAGTPGFSNCNGVSVSALSIQYGGSLSAAAKALGYPNVQALQNTMMAFCSAGVVWSRVWPSPTASVADPISR
jgi:YVTN family beta-propeller protein